MICHLLFLSQKTKEFTNFEMVCKSISWFYCEKVIIWKLRRTIYIILNFGVFFFYITKSFSKKKKGKKKKKVNKWDAKTRHGSNKKGSKFLFQKIKLSSVLKPDNNSVFWCIYKSFKWTLQYEEQKRSTCILLWMSCITINKYQFCTKRKYLTEKISSDNNKYVYQWWVHINVWGLCPFNKL